MIAGQRILVYGHDPMLLKTRRWVLEKAGYTVQTATGLAQVEKLTTTYAIDLLLLCHTLPAKDRKEALVSAKTISPRLRELSLTTNSSDQLTSKNELEVLVHGPQALINEVTKILHASLPELEHKQ